MVGWDGGGWGGEGRGGGLDWIGLWEGNWVVRREGKGRMMRGWGWEDRKMVVGLLRVVGIWMADFSLWLRVGEGTF